MKLDKKGLDLIKSFEGCKLKAYKCVPTEKYYLVSYFSLLLYKTNNIKKSKLNKSKSYKMRILRDLKNN